MLDVTVTTQRNAMDFARCVRSFYYMMFCKFYLLSTTHRTFTNHGIAKFCANLSILRRIYTHFQYQILNSGSTFRTNSNLVCCRYAKPFVGIVLGQHRVLGCDLREHACDNHAPWGVIKMHDWSHT